MKSTDEIIAELLDLLTKAQELGLTFSIGRAYISRQYIDEQCELNTRIRVVKREYETANK